MFETFIFKLALFVVIPFIAGFVYSRHQHLKWIR